MRPKTFLAVATCCVLTVLASPCFADAGGAQAGGPIASMFAPAKCGTLTTMDTPEPLFMTCTVQVECADSSVISCSGNTCSSSGPDNSCVTCNSVQQGCCPGGETCCQTCEELELDCFNNCPPELSCNWCNTTYNHCVANCTGGC